MRVADFERAADEMAIILPTQPRVVPGIAYKGDQEPFWLQLKDIADRLIAAASCAEENMLSWHAADAPVGQRP
jgi:hypothetical protein